MSPSVPATPSAHFGVMANPATRRLACNHCHAQKLRCTKVDNNDTICTRCQRLKRPCVWSSPLHSGRPPKNRPVSLSDPNNQNTSGDVAANSNLNVEANPILTPPVDAPHMAQPEQANADPQPPISAPEWNLYENLNFLSPISFDNNTSYSSLWTPPATVDTGLNLADPGFPFHIASTQEMESIQMTGLESGPVQQDEPSRSLDRVAQKLCEHNLCLLQLHDSLRAEPWLSMFESPTAVVTKLTSCHDHMENITSNYPLADIFKKTQSLIDFAKTITTGGSLSPPLSRGSASSSLRQHGGFSSSSSESETSYGREGQKGSSSDGMGSGNEHVRRPAYQPHTSQSRLPRNTSALELSEALVLASCYRRILDIYSTVFTHIMHFDQALSFMRSSGGPDYRAKMSPAFPPLQWGAFQPSHYGPLQMLMVVQVASFLLAETDRTLGVDEWARRIVARSRDQSQDRSHRPRPSKRRRENSYGDSDKSPSTALLSWDLVEMVVREDGPLGADKPQLGRVATLRRLMRKVKKQLEAGGSTR